MKTKSSTVHNKETSVLESNYDSYGSYRRESHLKEFSAAWSVYDYMDDADHRSKADLLSGCRQNAWFSRHSATGEIRIISNACHLRWCPVCAESRRNFVGFSVAEWLKEVQYPKLMTLTLRHRDTPLINQVTDLYRYFLQLRKLKDFRTLVTGGIWFFQVLQTGKNKEWHVHIHCVVTGKYFPRAHLKHLWLGVTGDSMITDIRSVKDPEGCALEVARYAARPGPLKDLTLDDAIELVWAMHGRRLCGTWGTGRKCILKPPLCSDKDSWSSVGSWGMVMRNRKTDVVCNQIYAAWSNHEPLVDGISCYKQEARARGEHVFIANENTVLEEIYSESWVPP